MIYRRSVWQSLYGVVSFAGIILLVVQLQLLLREKRSLAMLTSRLEGDLQYLRAQQSLTSAVISHKIDLSRAIQVAGAESERLTNSPPYAIAVITTLSGCTPCYVELVHHLRRFVDTITVDQQRTRLAVVFQARSPSVVLRLVPQWIDSVSVFVDTTLQFDGWFRQSMSNASIVALLNNSSFCVYAFSYTGGRSEDLWTNLSVMKSLLSNL